MRERDTKKERGKWDRERDTKKERGKWDREREIHTKE